MDFTFSEDQIMVRDLARSILEKEVTPERLKQHASEKEWCDRALWSTLAEAGLLGLTVPAGAGGMGFGFLEACILLHEVGRAVAPIPVLPTLVLGGLTIAEDGSAAQQKEWLEPMAAGTVILSAALADAGSSDPGTPATQARRDGSGWIVDGEKHFVPAAALAARILVPARISDGVGIFLVDPRTPGVTLTPRQTSSGDGLFTLSLAHVRLDARDLLDGSAGEGSARARLLHERALVALAAVQVGVCERALEHTSRYVRERVQFGVPIGSFQAVQHRAADCYIDLAAMRWVTWRAAWKLAQGLPAARETAVAKFWTADGGARITAAAQHLHGGIGVDLDYPIHRYFLWSKALELALGGATQHLAHLGRDMARSGPSELT